MNETKLSGQKQLDIETIIGLNQSGTSTIWQSWRWKILTGVFITIALGLYVLMNPGGSGNTVQYITEPVSRSDLTVMVTATGSVQPTNEVDISSELSGTIRKVLVDYNDKVKINQILAVLDTDKLNAAVESSKAKLAAARAKVKNAQATLTEKKLEFDRKSRLARKGITTTHDLEVSRASYKRASASLDSSRADVSAAIADLKLTQTTLAKTCICSPIQGVVLKRNVEPGQTVASSLQAPVLFTIAEDLSKMEVQVDVDEADVGKVSKGQQAIFTVDAYPGKSFAARIKELHLGSEVVQGVVTYKAILSTNNSELLLRPGMTATAEIIIMQVKDIVTVPNAALRFSPSTANKSLDNRSFLQKLLPGPPMHRRPSIQALTGNKRSAWIILEGEAKKIIVTIGQTDGRRTHILKGDLQPGQAVIVDTATKKK